MSEPEVHSTQGLRQRKMPPQATSAADAREAVLEMNTREEKNDKPDGERKTFGRTPDGTGKYCGFEITSSSYTTWTLLATNVVASMETSYVGRMLIC